MEFNEFKEMLRRNALETIGKLGRTTIDVDTKVRLLNALLTKKQEVTPIIKNIKEILWWADSKYIEIDSLLKSQASQAMTKRINLWESRKLIALKIAFWNKKSRPTASNIAESIDEVHQTIEDIKTEIRMDEQFDLQTDEQFDLDRIKELEERIRNDDVGVNDIEDIRERFNTIDETIRHIQEIERKLIIEKQNSRSNSESI